MTTEREASKDKVLQEIKLTATDRLEGFVQDYGLYVFTSLALVAIGYMVLAAAYNN